MKIVAISGSGLIAASPDTIAGQGLAEAPAGAQVVVDVANSPSLEDQPSGLQPNAAYSRIGRHVP
jgi:hypothetical protein